MTGDDHPALSAGGAAGASGLNFQALATAVCMTHIATGQRLDWLEGIEVDVPVAVSAETGGPGDDIMVELANGHRLEAQVKRGLTKGPKLWDALRNITTGLSNDLDLRAVLIISADSSSTIRQQLAKDMSRIASGRTDGLRSISKDFMARTMALEQDVATVARRLRIVTLDSDHVRRIMRRDLEILCTTATEARHAALTLEEDAKALIERRGRRNLRTITQTLASAEISLTRKATLPAATLGRLTSWKMEDTASFRILGVERPLPVEDAWLPLTVVKETAKGASSDLAEALRRYHEDRAPDRDASAYDIEWLGRFVRRCVVVGGPGSGKSLASIVLARRYAQDDYPVLWIRLSQLAARLRDGVGVEEAVWTLGLDGSGIKRSEAETLKDWVLIADGLDECGTTIERVAEGLARLAAGHPDLRIIVTTRPIGYDTKRFETWRHYQIAPLEESTVEASLTKLTNAIDEKSIDLRPIDLSRDISEELRAALQQSPLLLALTAALLAAGRSISGSRKELYEAMLTFAEWSGRARGPTSIPSAALLERVLNLLGEKAIADPLARTIDVNAFVRDSLAQELAKPPLAVADDAERAIAYWLGVGLFERVRHLDHEAYTFVHRTFAEFAAARHLVTIARTEPETVQDKLSDKAWTEVIAFAARLGLAESVIEKLLEGTHRPALAASRVRQALEIAGAPEVVLPLTLADTLARRACNLVRTGRRDLAIELGDALQGAVSRYPQLFRTHFEPLGTSASIWTRTLTFTVLASAEPTDQDLKAALAHLTAVRELVEGPEMYPLGVINTERNPADLVSRFLFATTALIFDRLPKGEVLRMLERILPFREHLNINFAMRLDRLLGDHDLTEWRKGQPSSLDGILESFGRRPMSPLAESLHVAFGSLVSPDRPVAEVPPPAEGDVLVELSGLMEATRLWEAPLSSMIGGSDPSDIVAARHVFHAIATLSSLDSEALEIDARRFDVACRCSEEEEHPLHRLTRHIDVPEPQWDKAAALDLDLDLLETAILRGSGWIARNAGPLLQHSTPKHDLMVRLLRLLETATNDGLETAAMIATTLEPDDAVPMLCDAIKASEGKDRTILFLALGQTCQWDGRILVLCEGALLGRSVHEAAAAADLFRTLAPADPSVAGLADRAYDQWREHEEPYPAKGGVIPPSPRESLLIIRISCGISIDALMDAAVDPRSDVQDVALAELVTRAAFDPATRAAYATECLDGKLGTKALRRLFRDDTPDAAIDANKLIALLQSADGERRHLALHLLNERFLPRNQIINECERLLSDPLDEVSRRAEHILSALEATV